MRAAIVTNGVVTNVIVVDSQETAAAFGAIICPNYVNIGWGWDGTTWTEPPQEATEVAEEEPQE